MGLHRQNKAVSIERRKRMLALEKCMLQGFTNQPQLAAKFGVSQKTISLDMAAIFDAWTQSGPNTTKERRAYRVKQLEYVIQVATDGYQRSRNDQRETTTQVREVPCETCLGIGRVKNSKGSDGGYKVCKICDGDGVVKQEVTTDKVKGSCGDPAFLNVIQGCLKEINRLEGNHPARKHQVKASVSVDGKVLHGHLLAEDPRKLGDPQAVMKARIALDELRQTVESPKLGLGSQLKEQGKQPEEE